MTIMVLRDVAIPRQFLVRIQKSPIRDLSQSINVTQS